MAGDPTIESLLWNCMEPLRPRAAGTTIRERGGYHQTEVGVERIKYWSETEGHLQDDDLFISADVDEVMSPAALQQLKWCQTKEVRLRYS